MTKLLDKAVKVARALSPEAQDDIARVVLRLTGTEDEAQAVPLSAEERAAVDASMQQAERGEFATDEQVRAVWAKHGL
jgi:predicted transcriptional regulator